ncbi:MAG TPA: DUF2062 domain-containing protein, partial [Nitrospiraceae bacterium]|nr:DUF2062 domain-containing protein [Nitrospiraceae bacterium]
EASERIIAKVDYRQLSAFSAPTRDSRRGSVVSIARLRSYLSQILHLHESPHRTALAFAVGVFIAFSPTYGLHTLSVVFCTWAFRLNFLALMAGAAINNPWTLVPILGATIWTGFKLLGIQQAAPFNWDDLSLLSLYEQLLPYALPLVVGGIFLGILGALLCYPAAYLVISRHRVHGGRTAVEGGPLPPRTGLS